jgi:hypothetical protein
MVGTPEGCLQLVVLKRRDIRYGIISSLEYQGFDIAGKRWSGNIEPAGGTVPGELDLSYIERYGFTEHTGIDKLILRSISNLYRCTARGSIGKDNIIRGECTRR